MSKRRILEDRLFTMPREQLLDVMRLVPGDSYYEYSKGNLLAYFDHVLDDSSEDEIAEYLEEIEAIDLASC